MFFMSSCCFPIFPLFYFSFSPFFFFFPSDIFVLSLFSFIFLYVSPFCFTCSPLFFSFFLFFFFFLLSLPFFFSCFSFFPLFSPFCSFLFLFISHVPSSTQQRLIKAKLEVGQMSGRDESAIYASGTNESGDVRH